MFHEAGDGMHELGAVKPADRGDGAELQAHLEQLARRALEAEKLF